MSSRWIPTDSAPCMQPLKKKTVHHHKSEHTWPQTSENLTTWQLTWREVSRLATLTSLPPSSSSFATRSLGTAARRSCTRPTACSSSASPAAWSWWWAGSRTRTSETTAARPRTPWARPGHTPRWQVRNNEKNQGFSTKSLLHKLNADTKLGNREISLPFFIKHETIPDFKPYKRRNKFSFKHAMEHVMRTKHKCHQFFS